EGQDGVVLCFRLPGHGDATLQNLNTLRSSQHFCDITIVASDQQTFRGHKVVLAACSPFLRDQFLLNPSSELQVSMLYSSSVVCQLLQSCYTGILQFNPKEIVNYLTAASYLQMEHVVEKCRGALSQYLQPRVPSPSGVSLHAFVVHFLLNIFIRNIGFRNSVFKLEFSFDTPDLFVSIKTIKLEENQSLLCEDRRQLSRARSPPASQLAPLAPPNRQNSQACVDVHTQSDLHKESPVDENISVVKVFQCINKVVFFIPALSNSLTMHARSAHPLFVCPRCGKQFNHASNLNRHMSIHRGTKSHACHLCHKTFTQKSTLRDHMNLHSGERPHRCSYCHVRFAHKPALRRHLREQHGKTTAQNCMEAQREKDREREREERGM
uniref:Zinc finger and BTB domain containing 12, tandem duplicate 1 n=1 Tax=Scleropages formosus TaxID=113540 RepID=A0A8C9WJL5_SCLFO